MAAVAASWGCSAEPDIVAIRDTTISAPAEPQQLPLSGDLSLFDPSAIFDSERYWVVSTGAGMPVRVSADLTDFELLGNAVAGLPEWAAVEVPAAGNYWSPDIAFFGGRYHLYYALASNTPRQACIGHATAAQLGIGADVWTDDGAPLVCTQQESDWFAIDPSVLVDEDGSVWLLIGSAGTGLKLFALEPSGELSAAEPTVVAARPDEGILQASAITRKGDFYYLFTSFDVCCRGADSNRSIRYGRSRSKWGPYVDRTGAPLLEGGGSTLLESASRWRGPGSNDVLHRGDRSYSFYFAYDAENEGRTSLRISTLVWDADGWPRSAGP